MCFQLLSGDNRSGIRGFVRRLRALMVFLRVFKLRGCSFLSVCMFFQLLTFYYSCAIKSVVRHVSTLVVFLRVFLRVFKLRACSFLGF
jgi:hypothetical protein